MKTSAVSAGPGWEPGRSRLFTSENQNLGSLVKVSVWHTDPYRVNSKFGFHSQK